MKKAMVMAWYKDIIKFYQNKQLAEQRLNIILPAEQREMSYIDCDNDGIFARYVHVTSSARVDDIMTKGLMPLLNPKKEVNIYLKNLSNKINDKDIESVTDCKEELAHPLLNNRFNYHIRKTFMLPLIGSDTYLLGAGANAVQDGGEIFMAARQAMEDHLGIEIAAPFPDAEMRLLVTKMYFVYQNRQLTLIDIDDFFPLEIGQINKNMYISPFEARTSTTINANSIIDFSKEEFFSYRRVVISNDAEQYIARLLAVDL